MNTNRKLVPSRTLVVYSILICGIVGYAIYYAFTEGNLIVRVAVVAAAVLLLFPILKMPLKIYEDEECIRIKQIVGEKVFIKKDYSINPVETKSLFSIRLFATSVFVYWGYFWTKSMGSFYALCVDNKKLILLIKKSDGSKIVIDAPSD